MLDDGRLFWAGVRRRLREAGRREGRDEGRKALAAPMRRDRMGNVDLIAVLSLQLDTTQLT